LDKLLAMRPSGGDILITYAVADVAKWLKAEMLFRLTMSRRQLGCAIHFTMYGTIRKHSKCSGGSSPAHDLFHLYS